MKHDRLQKMVRLLCALVLAAVLSVFAGCGQSGAASGDSPKNKLAFFLPLTGDQMQYGISLRRGAELALKQFNEKHGAKFVIEVFDDKGDPKESVTVANKIVSDPAVIAGMGSFSSSCAMAAAPVFEEADLLLFSPNASHTDFPAMGENMFSVVMSQKYEGAEFAQFLFGAYGGKTAAILYQNTDHGVIATDVFTRKYTELGGSVILTENFVPGQTKDFSPVLSKIKTADPGILYANASYNDCAQIFMQAKALNMKCLLVGPGMLLTEEFLNVVGSRIDGTIVMSSVPSFLPSVLEGSEVDEKTKTFIESYVQTYDESPDGFAASAFDAVNIVLNAVMKVGPESPDLRAELVTLRDYPGVSGYDMRFNENKEMIKGIYAFEIADGRFVSVK
jgi:branched-chain amino acid transport system substrate-binding protein